MKTVIFAAALTGSCALIYIFYRYRLKLNTRTRKQSGSKKVFVNHSDICSPNSKEVDMATVTEDISTVHLRNKKQRVSCKLPTQVSYTENHCTVYSNGINSGDLHSLKAESNSPELKSYNMGEVLHIDAGLSKLNIAPVTEHKEKTHVGITANNFTCTSDLNSSKTDSNCTEVKSDNVTEGVHINSALSNRNADSTNCKEESHAELEGETCNSSVQQKSHTNRNLSANNESFTPNCTTAKLSSLNTNNSMHASEYDVSVVLNASSITPNCTEEFVSSFAYKDVNDNTKVIEDDSQNSNVHNVDKNSEKSVINKLNCDKKSCSEVMKTDSEALKSDASEKTQNDTPHVTDYEISQIEAENSSDVNTLEKPKNKKRRNRGKRAKKLKESSNDNTQQSEDDKSANLTSNQSSRPSSTPLCENNLSSSKTLTHKKSSSLEKNENLEKEPSSSPDQLCTSDLERENSLSPEQEHITSDCQSLISQASVDSGQGSIEIDQETLYSSLVLPESNSEQYVSHQFEVPQALVGKLIGKKGAFLNKLKSATAANVVLIDHVNNSFKLCVLDGKKWQVSLALDMIRELFPIDQFPELPLIQVGFSTPMPSPQHQPQMNRQILQVDLPPGVVVEVQASAVISTGEVWLQQPLHPTFSALQSLQQCLNINYEDGTSTPMLPLPITPSTVCVCQIGGQWYRCQVLEHDHTNCTVTLLDVGGHVSLPISLLRQIKVDYISLPFQATQCYLYGIQPSIENGWGEAGRADLQELIKNNIIYATIAAYSQDGVPLVNLYQRQFNQYIFINERLVELGHARWMASSIAFQAA